MLMAIDLSCNELGEMDASEMVAAMQENSTVTSLDLRSNASLKGDQAAPLLEQLHQIVQQNELESRSYSRK